MRRFSGQIRVSKAFTAEDAESAEKGRGAMY